MMTSYAENDLAFSIECEYSYYEQKSHSKYTHRCIDGRSTGCGNCVGYCRYDGHRGFLTRKLREEHDCIKKRCFYYLPKTNQAKRSTPKHIDVSVEAVSDILSPNDGIRAMKIEKNINGTWIVKYITITNAYSIADMENALSERLGGRTSMIKLNYDYERAAQLICM